MKHDSIIWFSPHRLPAPVLARVVGDIRARFGVDLIRLHADFHQVKPTKGVDTDAIQAAVNESIWVHYTLSSPEAEECSPEQAEALWWQENRGDAVLH